MSNQYCGIPKPRRVSCNLLLAAKLQLLISIDKTLQVFTKFLSNVLILDLRYHFVYYMSECFVTSTELYQIYVHYLLFTFTSRYTCMYLKLCKAVLIMLVKPQWVISLGWIAIPLVDMADMCGRGGKQQTTHSLLVHVFQSLKWQKAQDLYMYFCQLGTVIVC